MTVPLAEQPTQSAAAEKLLPLFVVVSRNAPNVEPTPAQASRASATAIEAASSDLRRDHNLVLLPLRFFPPDGGDLVPAEDQDRGEDQEESSDRTVDVEQNVAETHDPVPHPADASVPADGPFLAVVVGIALRHEEHPVARGPDPPHAVGNQSARMLRVPVRDDVANPGLLGSDPLIHDHVSGVDGRLHA